MDNIDKIEVSTQGETPTGDDRSTFWTEWAKGRTPEEIGQMLAEKEKEAEHDHLTGILNKRGLTNRMEEELKKFNGKQYSVIFLDLNYLGLINDKMGHEEGDYWVKLTAGALRSSARKGDLYGRWTQGDEFLVFLPSTTYEEAERIWKRIESSFNPSFLVSGGIAQRDGNLSLEETINIAEKQMYQTKQVKKGPTYING